MHICMDEVFAALTVLSVGPVMAKLAWFRMAKIWPRTAAKRGDRENATDASCKSCAEPHN